MSPQTKRKPRTRHVVRGFHHFQNKGVPVNRDAYVTRTHAAAAAGVAPRTLEGWRRRGWIPPTGDRRYLTTRQSRAHAGHVEYLLGDVLDAARDTRLNPRNPGRQSHVLVLA